MAIKERKQITGTEAQIKAFAGHEGVLAYATDTKRLHVLSGTAGQTTELANKGDIPPAVDISGKADKTYVDTELSKKAPLTHTHEVAQVNGLQDAINNKADASIVNGKINVSGDRGKLAGYEGLTYDTVVVNKDTSDCSTDLDSGTVKVEENDSSLSWTKVVQIGSSSTVSLGNNWNWVGGKAPEIKGRFSLLVCHWHGPMGGVANIINME